MIKTERFVQIAVSSAAGLHDRLLLHHAQAESVWLVTFKKHKAGGYVSSQQMLDALIAKFKKPDYATGNVNRVK